MSLRRVGASSTGMLRRHALAITIAALALAVASPVAALALTRGDDEALAVARARAASSTARLAEAQMQLAHLDTVRDAGAAEVELRKQVEERLTNAEAKIAALAAEVDAGKVRAQADVDTIARLRGRADVLDQCLDGTAVAIEFGRRGNWPAAERALSAVQDVCVQARSDNTTGG